MVIDRFSQGHTHRPGERKHDVAALIGSTPKRLRARFTGAEIMSNRHERRKATAICRKGRAKLKTATLDQHFDDMLRRVRAEFERIGEIHSVFECVTDGEVFHVPANWPDDGAKAAACAALRDSFRRRGVNRYVFAAEAWVGETHDPDRGDIALVSAVERNGSRRYASAEIRAMERRRRLGRGK